MLLGRRKPGGHRNSAPDKQKKMDERLRFRKKCITVLPTYHYKFLKGILQDQSGEYALGSPLSCYRWQKNIYILNNGTVISAARELPLARKGFTISSVT